jgi:uncharacterized protein
MSVSMYRLTVPIFQRGLKTLAAYLDKAEAYAKEKGIDSSILVNARLAPDMLSLAGQFQRATDTAKFAITRLTSTDAPKFEDNETTVAELRERLAKAEAYLATVTPELLEGSDKAEVTRQVGGKTVTLSGEDYLATFVLPNFYFHIGMAHAILRNQGAPVGKMDYLGNLG